jgi:hypothetical protein
MKPTIAIGDVHGLITWKGIVEAHPDCRVVFLGDYLDPYQPVSPKTLLDNLREIIALKQQRPEDVVLLLGNHDLHYFVEEAEIGTRFDLRIAVEASEIFRENYASFCFAFQDEQLLFTHAGVTQAWFDEDFHGDSQVDIAGQLNHPASDEQKNALFQVGRLRGGRYKNGGIFWADAEELYEPLRGYTQIVGHNQVPDVFEHSNKGGRILFCDCLRQGHYLKV